MKAPRLYQLRPGEWFLDTRQPFADEIPVPSWLVEAGAFDRADNERDKRAKLDDLARALSGLYGIGRRMGFADGQYDDAMRVALGIDSE